MLSCAGLPVSVIRCGLVIGDPPTFLAGSLSNVTAQSVAILSIVHAPSRVMSAAGWSMVVPTVSPHF